MKHGKCLRRAVLRSAVLRRGSVGDGGLKWIEALEARQLLSAAPLHFNVIDLGRPGGLDTKATAVNNVGQIAGQSITAAENIQYLPWVYNYSTGSLTDLTPVLGNEAEINSINDNGQMVGAQLTGQRNSYTDEPITTAFYYSGKGNTATTLPLAPGMESASAAGINDKGQIVVIERTAALPDGPYFFTYTYGFVYSASTGKMVSELPQADTDLGALAINNNGQIFENAYNPPFKEDSGTEEYDLYSGNKLTPITSGVSAPGPWFGNPIPPSLGNTIFGYQTSGGPPLGDTQFGSVNSIGSFFFSGGQSVDLNDTLPANANLTVDSVAAINASNVIVGQGNNEEGQHNAFLLYPVNESISGTVFNDVNHNGVQDPGETGVAGVTVYQDPNYNHKLDATEESVVTDASGYYSFAGPFLAPPADPEILRIILPSGAAQTSPANGVGIYVGKNTGQTLTGENFGISLPHTASISGTVFNDTNHDGIQDNGETGRAGVTVYQDPNYNHKLDAGEQRAVTDAQGNYTFTNLPADPEILRIILPSGTAQTSPANGVGIYVGKNTGQTLTGENFGVSGPATASISGVIYNDLNSDQMQDDGGAGVGGALVYVDLNNTGSFVAGDPNTTTDDFGNFTITGIAPGQYTVRENPPFGDVEDVPGANNGIPITLSAGQSLAGVTFGVIVPWFPPNADFSGVVFNDANGDGVMDDGETGVQGVTVYEDPNYNHKLDIGEDSAITGPDGSYRIVNADPDPEILRVVLPGGAQQTSPANGVGIYVGKNVGQAVDGLNFGILLPNSGGGTGNASVTGTVINDSNGDHVFEFPAEHYQPGITAFVDYNQNGILDAGEPSAISDSSGNFTIKNVADGTWYVDVVTGSNGYRRTLPVAGPDSFRVTVTGKNTVGVGIFGVTTTAYVGGTLFNDTNSNGVQDPHEVPLAGWKVYIDLNNDGVLESNEPTAQTVTTSVGYWYFRAVAPGTYTIRAVAPSGWTSTHAFTVTLTSSETIINGAIGEKSA